MSDSIFIKNSVFNDVDSLSSFKMIRVDGVKSHQLTFHAKAVSTAVNKASLKPITAEVVSQTVYPTEKDKDILIRTICTFVPSLKFTAYVYEKKKTYIKPNYISTNAITVSHNKDIRGSASSIYIKGEKKDPSLLIMPYVTTEVVNKKPTDYLVDMFSTKVTQGKRKSEDGLLLFPALSVDVNNDYPMSEGGLGSATGGDLEKMVFTIQQLSFFEFRFYFRMNKVKEVRNLPQGMQFDIIKQRMFGTPLQSGRYPITIILEDESTVQGIIEVPQLNRKL